MAKLLLICHPRAWYQLHFVEDANVKFFEYYVREELGCILDQTPEIRIIACIDDLISCVDFVAEAFPGERVAASLPAPENLTAYDWKPNNLNVNTEYGKIYDNRT
jgi:hypothetical protein